MVDPLQFDWTDDWRGRPWSEVVLYELHVGAFTREGTFMAACDRLESLARLGITAVEIMPVADFPGRRNWGYDGVFQENMVVSVESYIGEARGKEGVKLEQKVLITASGAVPLSKTPFENALVI